MVLEALGKGMFNLGGDILHCNPLHGTVLISNASNTVEWISIPWSGFQYRGVDFDTVPWSGFPCRGVDFNTVPWSGF